MIAYSIEELRLIISRLNTIRELDTFRQYISKYKKDYPLVYLYEIKNKIHSAKRRILNF